MPTPLTDADKVLRNDTGIDIATNIASIASALTPSNITDLGDVNLTNPITDGQVIKYDTATQKWVNGLGNITMECTQAQYDAWKQSGQLKPNTLYVITDAPNLNETAQDISYDGDTDSVYDVVESHGIFPTALTLSDVGSNVSTNGSMAIKLSDKLILIYFDYVCSSASTSWVSLFDIAYANSINNCWGIVVDSTNSFVAYTQAYYDSGKIKVRVQGCNTNATRGQMLIVTA